MNKEVTDQTVIDDSLDATNNSTYVYECALTTFDNPFDPFEQFDRWFLYDIEKGYYTCNLLARVSMPPGNMSNELDNAEIERAIDEVIQYDYQNIYKKVKRIVE